jgi:hypothetical protein
MDQGVLWRGVAGNFKCTPTSYMKTTRPEHLVRSEPIPGTWVPLFFLINCAPAGVRDHRGSARAMVHGKHRFIRLTRAHSHSHASTRTLIRKGWQTVYMALTSSLSAFPGSGRFFLEPESQAVLRTGKPPRMTNWDSTEESPKSESQYWWFSVILF